MQKRFIKILFMQIVNTILIPLHTSPPTISPKFDFLSITIWWNFHWNDFSMEKFSWNLHVLNVLDVSHEGFLRCRHSSMPHKEYTRRLNNFYRNCYQNICQFGLRRCQGLKSSQGNFGRNCERDKMLKQISVVIFPFKNLMKTYQDIRSNSLPTPTKFTTS